MKYLDLPIMIPLLAAAYLVTIYLILTLIKRSIRVTPKSTK